MTTSALPLELAASSTPWFSRARNYAIFSPEWFRYRSRAILTCWTLVIVFYVVYLVTNGLPTDWLTLGALFGIYAAGAVTLVLLGPWLAVLIRRRVWSPRRETAAILCALLFGMACAFGVMKGLRGWYERPDYDRVRDVLINRSLPQLNFRVEMNVTSSETSGLRDRGTVKVDPAVYRRYADAFGLPAQQKIPAPQDAHECFNADDCATLESIRKLDAGTLHMNPSERKELERRYLLVVQKFHNYMTDEMAKAQSEIAEWKSEQAKAHFSSTEPPAGPGQMTPAQVAASKDFFATVGTPKRAAPVPDAPASQALQTATFVAANGVIFIAGVFLLCWLGGLFDLRAFVRQRGKLDEALTRQALARARDERNTAELKLSVLAAQVEPHFLFNTLASVRAAIASDPGRAAHIIDHMVDYLRATIPQMRGDAAATTVPLDAQMAAARSYLALMHERTPRLSYSVDIEPGLERAAIPPLMLISLVENAVKHGVEPKVGPANIAVKARRHEGELEVSVTDDGIGFGDASAGAGIGLPNIKDRLRTLFGQRASLTLKTCPDGGVAAILRVPLSIEI